MRWIEGEDGLQPNCPPKDHHASLPGVLNGCCVCELLGYIQIDISIHVHHSCRSRKPSQNKLDQW